MSRNFIILCTLVLFISLLVLLTTLSKITAVYKLILNNLNKMILLQKFEQIFKMIAQLQMHFK